MSKKKKTMDELLEEAAVLEDEQPFEIPENWVWVSLGSILISMKNGTTLTQNKIKLGYPITRIETVQQNKLDNNRFGYIENEKLKNDDFYEVGDIVLSHINSYEHVGKTAVIEEKHLPLVHGMNLLRMRTNTKRIEPKYLQFYMRTHTFRMEVRDRVNHAVNQVSINQKMLSEIAVPICPLNEQKRITDKIEILFGKLDKVKQLIEEVKEKSELRRAAILTKAFEMYEPTSYKTIEEVCTIKNGYAFKSKDFVDEGVQLVRMGNLYQNQLDLSRSPVYLPSDYNEKLLDKYSIKNGDILLTLTGTKYKRDYGYAVKIENLDVDLLLNQRIMSLTPNTEDDYLYYFLQTSEFRNDFFSFETGGVNQGNVGSKSIATIKIPWIEDISKRIEVVNSIQKQLKVEKLVSEILNNQLDIDNLKQSILSKAFKGELGTNDPTDEPAIELLKSILQEKL